ncbi:GntR family transcriptional regulator [Treponema sp.]
MKKIETTNLTDVVYERIKAMILEGILVPGSKINKKDLAEALAVSQTPINEAVSRLSGENLITQKPRLGFFVREYDNKYLADLFAVRGGLESVALRLCVEEGSPADIKKLSTFFSSFSLPLKPSQETAYMDEDIAFHSAIIEFAHVDLLKEFKASLGYILKTYEHGLVRPPSETLMEHKAIIEALEQGDGRKAEALLLEHHLASRKALLATLPLYS